MTGHRSTGWLTALFLLGVIGSLSSLRASTYSLTGPEQLFVSLSKTLILDNSSVIKGDVGLSSDLQMQNTTSILALPPYTGAADFSGSVTCIPASPCPGGTVAGGTHGSIANVTTAINDYTNLISMLTGLSGGTNIAINPPAAGQTLSTPGTYNATSFTMTTGGNLTLNGTSTDQYVIRVPGLSTLNISAGSIILTGGLLPDSVIFLFDPTTAGQNFNWNSSGKFSGILLGNANVANITFSNTTNPSSVGRVILPSGTIQFNGGGFVGAGGFPEPPTFSLVGLGLVIIAFKLRLAKGPP